MIAPDTQLAAEYIGSPNHDPRVGDDLDMIILHYTGMESGLTAQQRLCDLEAKVSSHYLVFEDGRIVQLVKENRRARHAGVSSWCGWTDINSRSIGIEIVNGGHSFGLPDFPSSQIAAVIALCRDIQFRWPIPPANVLGHSDVAPSRKQDPGEKFPWPLLHAAGVGLLVAPAPIEEGFELKIGDIDDAVLQMQQLLLTYGYGIVADGIFDTRTHDVVVAFQRHFRPQRIDGIVDVSTVKTLRLVLSERGRTTVKTER